MRSVYRVAGGAGTARSLRSRPPGSSSTGAELNPEPRKESVLSSLWVCGRRGGEHGARRQPSGIGRGGGARTGRAGWSGCWEGCGSPEGSRLAPTVGRAVLHPEERPTGLGRAARSQPEPPWTLWAFAEPFWTRLSLSVEVPRGVRQAGGVGLPRHPGAVGRSLSPVAGKRPLSRIAGGLAYLGYRSDPPGPRATPGSERSRAGAPDLLIPALPSAAGSARSAFKLRVRLLPPLLPFYLT